jgi:hypothetical protein
MTGMMSGKSQMKNTEGYEKTREGETRTRKGSRRRKNKENKEMVKVMFKKSHRPLEKRGRNIRRSNQRTSIRRGNSSRK